MIKFRHGRQSNKIQDLVASDFLRSPQVSPFHSQSKFLKIISDDEDVMEDQIYVLPEKLITKPNGLSMLKIFEDY